MQNKDNICYSPRLPTATSFHMISITCVHNDILSIVNLVNIADMGTSILRVVFPVDEWAVPSLGPNGWSLSQLRGSGSVL